MSAPMDDQPRPAGHTLARRRLLTALAALGLGLGTRPAAALDPGMLPWHHLPDGTFRNPPGSPERGGTPAEWRSFLWRRLVDPPPVPEVPGDHVLPADTALAQLAAANGRDSVTWLGHASFLIRIGGPHAADRPLSDRARLAPALVRSQAPGRAVPGAARPAPDRRAPAVAQSLRPSGPASAGAARRYQRGPGGDAAAGVALCRAAPLRGDDRAGLAADGAGRGRPDHRPSGDPLQQARPVRPQRQPVVRLHAGGGRAPHPVHRRHGLRAGVRRDGGQAATARPGPGARSARTSRAT